MNRKTVWAVVSCLMVLALLAASCAKAEEKAPAAKEAAPVVKEAAPVVKEAAPAVKEVAPAAAAEMVKVTLTKLDGTKVEKLLEKPKYGGVLNVSFRTAILAWDEAYQPPWTLAPTLEQTNEDLITGDWKRGLLGTGENDWQYGDWVSPAYAAGILAESWEIADAETIIYHIRKGVKWQNKPPVNGREFTADDAVFNIKRIYFDIKTSTMYGMLGAARPTEVYATDKYTVVMKGPRETLGDRFEEVSDLTKMVPPEVVKKYGDMNAWENVVGTGAFMLTDYVAMSSATWVRNPNYWMNDPLRGPDYPLPYLNGLKAFIIPDVSTELAAVRTGKIDLPNAGYGSGRYALEMWKQIATTTPDIKYYRNAPTGCLTLGLTVNRGLPTDDIRVRKALNMAVDRFAIKDSYFGGDAAVLNYKVPPHPAVMRWYTPYEQLPPEIKEIYTYDPEKAKRLLAEAGYPNGFKTEVVLNPTIPYPDLAEILKAYWAKIGVDLSLDVKEFGTFMSIYQRKAHKYFLFCGRGQMVPAMYMCRKGNMYNWAMIDDPKIDDYYYPGVSAAYFDQPKKDALMKEMNLYVLSQAWYYFPPREYEYNVWQPWVKDYNGERGPGIYSGGNAWKYIWYDQELKKAMGH